MWQRSSTSVINIGEAGEQPLLPLYLKDEDLATMTNSVLRHIMYILGLYSGL